MSMAAILGLLLWLAPFAAAIPTVRLNNGVEMPIISAGTAGYNDSQAALAVRAALAGNVTAIHTAFDYFNLAGVAAGLEARPRREIFELACLRLAAAKFAARRWPPPLATTHPAPQRRSWRSGAPR